MESIITHIKDVCVICGSQDQIDIHHCLHGTSNRKNADNYGLTVPLCHKCHMDLHDKNTQMDLYFKKLAQVKFEERYDREKWFEVFGKSYLLVMAIKIIKHRVKIALIVTLDATASA